MKVPAYNKLYMESVILLLLLALSDKNETMKESLNRFLQFYKENRELIQMLATTISAPSAEGPNADIPPAKGEKEHEESRPQEKVGNLNVLEEYLHRAFAQ